MMMAFVRLIGIALALATCSLCSHPPESDQYEARGDLSRPLHTEATDNHPEIHLIKKSPHPFSAKHTEVFKQRQNSDVSSRGKRSFTPWASPQVVYTSPYESINVWRPPIYPLSRPYFIPIFGVSGRIPIYYPPQPFYFNQDAPLNNPNRKPSNPFQGPAYLPPLATTTTTEKSMTIDNRFNPDEDDAPIWDAVPPRLEGTTQSPTSVVPTRRTARPGVPSTHPPLVHKPNDGQAPNAVPAPADKEQDIKASAPEGARPAGPSNCVWAIVSCCSSSGINLECFAQRGCPGAFWDNSPCDSDFAKAAIASALNYYGNQ